MLFSQLLSFDIVIDIVAALVKTHAYITLNRSHWRHYAGLKTLIQFSFILHSRKIPDVIFYIIKPTKPDTTLQHASHMTAILST